MALRVALILETSGGGSGRHVLDLARGLLRAGHDVTVIWAPDRAAADFQAAMAAIPGLVTRTVPMQRAVGPGDMRSLRALTTLLARERPFDILHGHSSKAGALVRLLPRRIPGARIYTPHAFRTMDPALGAAQRTLYGTVERLLAPRAARIIAVSSAEREHATAHLRIPRDRLALVVNGVALPEGAERAAARAEMGLAPDALAIGFIGRLDPQKDPLRFVAAIRAAATRAAETGQGGAIAGLVIGDGPLRAEAEAAAAGAPIRFLGWQDGPRLIPGLDIFCMTSRYEAMPYTLIEALHAGVPIVTTAVGGASETVEEGVNGHVLPLSADAGEIGAALAALAGDDTRRRRFATAARRLSETRDIGTMVRETLAVYEAALDRGAARAGAA